MPRQKFGGTGADLVYNPGTSPGDPITNQIGLSWHVYSDEDATQPADIVDLNLAPISSATVTVNSASQIPDIWGPDTNPDGTGEDTFVLYIRAAAGGPIMKLVANGGIPGPRGDEGPQVSDERLAAAVATYLIANPPPPGANGVAVWGSRES